MKDVLGLVPDLMFETRISDAARALGLTFKAFSTSKRLADALGQTPSNLCIVSLDAPDWEQAVKAAKKAGAHILAFGSHKDIALMQAAQAAGCDLVVARSRMARELAALLRKFTQ